PAPAGARRRPASPRASWRDDDAAGDSWRDDDAAGASWRDDDAAGDSWRDDDAAPRRGTASRPPQPPLATRSRGSGIRFGEDAELDDDAEGTAEVDASNLARASRRGPDESSSEQTAELGAAEVARDLDDPDYDPFAEVEATQKKTKQADPEREKAMRVLSIVGLLGIAIAVGIYLQATKPGEWKKVDAPEPIRVAVGQTVRFDEPWAPVDPPAGRYMPDARGEPYVIEDGAVARVEWVVPHVEGRAIFLIHGLQEGEAYFQLRFDRSRRVKVFRIIVEGDDPHDLARDKRRAEFRKLHPKKLREILATAKATGDTYRERRDFVGKESYYRLSWQEYARAVDAAEALRSKGLALPEKELRAIEEAEQRAREEYDAFVQRELAIYRDLVRKNEPRRDRVDQLRRLLRGISHSCDARYKRFRLILSKLYEEPVNADGNEYCEHDPAR
ncbi:MAG: hypothetical protein D6731_03470, partial [Planctomycetota bacterium]